MSSSMMFIVSTLIEMKEIASIFRWMGFFLLCVATGSILPIIFRIIREMIFKSDIKHSSQMKDESPA